MLLLNVGVFGLILLLTLLLAVGEKRVILLGWVCVGFSVSVFVAPLSIIVRNIYHPTYRYSRDMYHQGCDSDTFFIFASVIAASGGAHSERGVHALLPLALAHGQRRRMVPLWPSHQGQICCRK